MLLCISERSPGYTLVAEIPSVGGFQQQRPTSFPFAAVAPGAVFILGTGERSSSGKEQAALWEKKSKGAGRSPAGP